MNCYEKLGTDKEPVRLLEDKLMEIREPCSLLQYECVRRAYFVRDQVPEEYRVQRIVQSLKGFLLRRGTGTCHGTITSWPSHFYLQSAQRTQIARFAHVPSAHQVLFTGHHRYSSSVFCNMYHNSLHPMQVLLVSVFAGSARENFWTFTSSLYLRLSFLTFV